MKSWMKGILALIFILGLVCGTASTSFAVFGDGAGDGGQLRDPSGRPMANVKVRITQLNPDGTRTVRETETDDRGFFFLPWSGGEVTQIQFRTGGKAYTFGGPFGDIPEVGGIILPGDPHPDDIILAYNLGDADSVTPTNGVWVTGANGGSGDMPPFKFGLNFGHKYGRLNTVLDRDGNRSDGADLVVSQNELSFDGRIYYGPLVRRGYFGNLGNLGNLGNYLLFGNLGNLGNIGNVGKFGLSDFYGGVRVGVGLSAKDTGLSLIEHTAIRDTFLRQRYRGSITAYVGFKVADFDEFGYFNVQAGGTVSWWEYLFSSDEMGTLHTNSQDDTKFGPGFGIEYNNPIGYGNLGMGNVFGGFPAYGGLQLRYWTEYVQGFALPASTGPVSNSTYVPSQEGGWISTFYVGWAMSL